MSPTRLFLGGLADAEVVQELLPRFEAQGLKVREWCAVRDSFGQFRGFGFCSFAAPDGDSEACEAVLEGLVRKYNKSLWKGHRLRVEHAQLDFQSRLRLEKAQREEKERQRRLEILEAQEKEKERIRKRREGLPADTFLIRDRSGTKRIRVSSNPIDNDAATTRTKAGVFRGRRKRKFPELPSSSFVALGANGDAGSDSREVDIKSRGVREDTKSFVQESDSLPEGEEEETMEMEVGTEIEPEGPPSHSSTYGEQGSDDIGDTGEETVLQTRPLLDSQTEDLAEDLERERDNALDVLASIFKKPTAKPQESTVESRTVKKAETRAREGRFHSLIQKRYRPVVENTGDRKADSQGVKAQSMAPQPPETTEQLVSSDGVNGLQGRRVDELKAYQDLFYREHTLATVTAFSDHAKTKKEDFAFGFELQAEEDDTTTQQVAAENLELPATLKSEEIMDESPPPLPGSSLFGFRTKAWEASIDKAFEKLRSEAVSAGSVHGGWEQTSEAVKTSRLVLRGNRDSFVQDYKRKIRVARRESQRTRGYSRRRT